jgi:hypothetical protein
MWEQGEVGSFLEGQLIFRTFHFLLSLEEQGQVLKCNFPPKEGCDLSSRFTGLTG